VPKSTILFLDSIVLSYLHYISFSLLECVQTAASKGTQHFKETNIMKIAEKYGNCRENIRNYR
jgi:hypothetical protein